MLDEKREYKQYTDKMSNFSGKNILNRRLKYLSLIKKDFSGIARALTIIARYVMFDDKSAGKPAVGVQVQADADHKEQVDEGKIDFDMNRVQAVLHAWMGFDYKSNEDYKKFVEYIDGLGIDHWLEKYIRDIFLNEALEKCRDDLTEDLICAIENAKIDNKGLLNIRAQLQELEKEHNDEKELKTGLNQAKYIIKAIYDLRMGFKYAGAHMFVPEYKSINTYTQGNSYREINFEKIIANAYSLGSLKTYLLVCNKAEFWSLIGRYTKENPNHGKTLLDSDKELILKLTAAFILQKQYENLQKQYGTQEQKYMVEQEYMAINQMDLANWLETKANPQKFELEKYCFRDKDDEKGAPLFASIKVNDNVKKLWIAPSWVSMFRLETKEQDIKKGEIFFADEDLGSKSNKGLEGRKKTK